MKNSYFKKWLAHAVGGLSLVGLGLSILGESIIAKYEQRSWFWLGTLSLIIVNSGISLVGKAVTYRIRLDNDE